MAPIYDRVALIGLGLIASSMAHAMRQSGLAAEIVGYARSSETRAAALEIGFCDRVTETAAEAVAGADLVVLAVPVGAMQAIAAEIGPHLAPGATVTDVGSVKQAVIAAVAPFIPQGVHFVPGHPIAGTEHSGPRSGFATLFQNRWWLLTPSVDTDPAAVARLRSLLEAMGANVDEMDAAHHDLVLAVTSHTPPLIA
jgi:cyclohexadieny/prephenate dehydrogenase